MTSRTRWLAPMLPLTPAIEAENAAAAAQPGQPEEAPGRPKIPCTDLQDFARTLPARETMRARRR